MSTPSAPATSSVVDLLSAAQLATLRGGFQEAVMIAATGATLTTLFPKSKVIVEAILDEYRGGDDLAPRDRERCIITLLSTRKSELTLAAHLYWGLMEGLEPIEIANTLLLVGAYAGIDSFASGILVFKALLIELAKLADTPGGGDAVRSPNVLQMLMANFRR